uniref:MFS domain-containing protein n=1 Tax=Heterorhabditis bacteriophora TaxID=37862 RepID=A0A1I7XSM1_HETBA
MSTTTTLSNVESRRTVCGCAGANSLIAYNATFVPMMDKTTSPLYNGTISSDIDWASDNLAISDRRFSFGFLEKSLSFAGGFTGSLIGTFPINTLIQRFGARRVMTVIGLLSTVLTALTPIVVSTSFPLFVVLRIFSGLSISNIFPVAGMIVNEWATTQEKGLFVAVLSGYVELSALFTMPMSGFIATAVGWDSVFYLHAILCGFFTLLWAIYYRDKPYSHPFVAEKEWRKISSGKLTQSDCSVTPPRLRIFRSMVIWAVWIAVIGNFLVAQFTISYSPMYLNYVLGFAPLTAGFLTIVPLGAQLVIKLFTGLASDGMTCMSEVAKLRLFNSIALLGSGLFFIIVSISPPLGSVADVILIIIPVALLGFSSGGFPKCAVMVSRQHSPFVMSIVQVTRTIFDYCKSDLMHSLVATFLILEFCTAVAGAFLLSLAITICIKSKSFHAYFRALLVVILVVLLSFECFDLLNPFNVIFEEFAERWHFTSILKWGQIMTFEVLTVIFLLVCLERTIAVIFCHRYEKFRSVWPVVIVFAITTLFALWHRSRIMKSGYISRSLGTKYQISENMKVARLVIPIIGLGIVMKGFVALCITFYYLNPDVEQKLLFIIIYRITMNVYSIACVILLFYLHSPYYRAFCLSIRNPFCNTLSCVPSECPPVIFDIEDHEVHFDLLRRQWEDASYARQFIYSSN